MSKNLYMHTINGKPAMYEDGRQIVYINKYHRLNMSDVFVDSLEGIKRQQLWSKQYREQHGLTYDGLEYGYIRIKDDRDAFAPKGAE